MASTSIVSDVKETGSFEVPKTLNFSSESFNPLTSKMRLLQIALNSGKNDQAEDIASALGQENLENYDISVKALAYRAVARTYRRLEKYADAGEYGAKAIAEWKQILGAETDESKHPSLNYEIASEAYYTAKDYCKWDLHKTALPFALDAMDHFETLLERLGSRFKSEHYDEIIEKTAYVHSRISEIYYHLKDQDARLPFLERAIQLYGASLKTAKTQDDRYRIKRQIALQHNFAAGTYEGQGFFGEACYHFTKSHLTLLEIQDEAHKHGDSTEVQQFLKFTLNVLKKLGSLHSPTPSVLRENVFSSKRLRSR